MGEPIIVAGGGIGGLTTALTLHEIGVPVRVFESSMAIRPLGVGINLQPNAVRELTDLGLADLLPDIGVEAEEWALVGRNGNDVWAELRGRRAGYRWPQFAVHRGELQMLLLDTVRERCGSDSVIEAHRSAHVRADGRLGHRHVRGSRAGRTVTVEGPFWSLRTGCTPPPAASASPTKVHRSGEVPCCGEARRWAGRSHRRIVHARRKPRATLRPLPDRPVDPATGLQRQNFIAELTFDPAQGWDAASWNQTVDPEVFLPAFADWDFDWLDIPALVGRAEQVWEYPMVDRDPAPTWVDSRVALLGDAAHVMYPVGSNGASQASSMLALLGASLVEHGLTPDALAAYQDRLHEDISALVLRNREAGPVAILGTVDERAAGCSTTSTT